MRDVERIIDQITSAYPAVKVRQLQVSHPGMDDDGIWFFEQPDCDFEVRIESSWGKCPFVIETDGSNARYRSSSIDETVKIVAALLHLESENDIDQYEWYLKSKK